MEKWVFDLILFLVGLVIAGNQYRLNDIQKSQNKTSDVLSKEIIQLRADKEALRSLFDSEFKAMRDGFVTEINGVSTRITQRISDIEKSVVFEDVFGQHEKIDENNQRHNEKMFNLMQHNIEALVKSNSADHQIMTKKIEDAMTGIRDEVKTLIKELKNG